MRSIPACGVHNVAQPLLQVDDLRTYFSTPHGIARAVDGVSFVLEQGETLALVGESGCGKSMTALSILQLVPEPAGYIDGGRILFEGKDLLDLTWSQMRQVRGNDIAMIFQEPMTSLNGTRTIGWQLVEAMEVHGKASGHAAQHRALEMLARVGLDQPTLVLRQYPHELSGGMRQRVLIAMALANEPKLLIADEPTTALDVTIQAQILDLMRDLQRELGMSVLLITHDLGIVAKMAQHVAVMYAGQIVEYAPTPHLFHATVPSVHTWAVRQSAEPSPAWRRPGHAGRRGAAGHALAPGLPLRATLPLSLGDLHADPAAHAGNGRLVMTVRCHLYDPDYRGSARPGHAAAP